MPYRTSDSSYSNANSYGAYQILAMDESKERMKCAPKFNLLHIHITLAHKYRSLPVGLCLFITLLTHFLFLTNFIIPSTAFLTIL